MSDIAKSDPKQSTEGVTAADIEIGAMGQRVGSLWTDAWYDLRRRAPEHHGDGHGDGHDGGHGHEHGGHHGGAGHDDGHGHHEPRVGWLLILPVLGLLLVAPPALGAFSADQAGSVLASTQQDSDFPPLPVGDPAPSTVLD